MRQTEMETINSDASASPGSSLSVAAFTGGETISSRRFRVHQYLPHFHKQGITVTEYGARFGSWPPTENIRRPFWLAATLADRLPGVAKSHWHDVTFLQREMVSTMLTLERFTHRPRVLDVDDAIWLNRPSMKTFPGLVRICDGVVCGNDFIAENVRQWNDELIVIPTPVDTDRFRPGGGSGTEQKQIIGWSGLHAGFKYLLSIEGALVKVLEKRKEAVLRVVSDVKPVFRTLDNSRVEYIPWSPANEVKTIQDMTAGLMPIDDSPWSRGKCSYKMLLYMSCGVPVVVSPFGMNQEVLRLGKVGLGARTESEWVESMVWLLDNTGRGREMGTAGRKVIEERYSLNLLAPRLASYLRRFCK
jgi:glycosyltransferase involved in cell wall biosynthesis